MQGTTRFCLVILALVLTGLALWHFAAPVNAAKTTPASGFTIHIDALQHFPNHPNEVAHHWCKPVSGLVECQIYSSDVANAPLIAVETVVPAATYNTFTADEKALWHYHRVEIPKVSATMPDVTPAVQKATFASLNETYGKIYVLWDPMDSSNPMGRPSVTILR